MKKIIINIFLIAVASCIVIGMVDNLMFYIIGRSFVWEILMNWLVPMLLE